MKDGDKKGPGVLRQFWAFARGRLFGDLQRNIQTAVAFGGAISTAIGGWSLLVLIIGWSKSHALLEGLYLWATFTSTTVLGVFYLVLLSTVQTELRQERGWREALKTDLAAEQRRSDAGALLLHQTIEDVRRAAQVGGEPDWSHLLTRLRDFVRETWSLDVCVTLKHYRKGELITVGRAAGTYQNRTKVGAGLSAQKSVVYGRLRAPAQEHPHPHIRHVHIEDAWVLDQRDHEYMDTAKRCSYRSVLAFPLRGVPGVTDATATPLSPVPTTVTRNPLFGFLSMDTKEDNAFTAWFADGPDGQKGKAIRALDVFYGFADAAATILLLAHRSEGNQDTPPSEPRGEGR